MSGLLRGWLDDADWPTALTYANACGAFAVSRHGCAPAYPSWTELQMFLKRGVKTPALRKDQELEQLHWSTTRTSAWDTVRIFAFDHRMQLEDLKGATIEKIGAFKSLCIQACKDVSGGRDPGHSTGRPIHRPWPAARYKASLPSRLSHNNPYPSRPPDTSLQA